MKAVIISGTPGTGKTLLAKKLAKELRLPLINLTDYIKRNKSLQCGRDADSTIIVNERKLITSLQQTINSLRTSIIIEGHLAHLLPKRDVACCIITTCALPVLKARLKARHYPRKKIRENLDAEIVQVCLTEALQRRHQCLAIDATHLKHIPTSLLKAIRKCLKRK